MVSILLQTYDINIFQFQSKRIPVKQIFDDSTVPRLKTKMKSVGSESFKHQNELTWSVMKAVFGDQYHQYQLDENALAGFGKLFASLL